MFFDIQRRGPKAFGNLIKSLEEIDDIHRRLAYALENNDTTVLELEVENNNCTPSIVDEQEADRPHNVTNGAYPFKLTEEQRPPHIRQLSLEIPNSNINLSEEPLIVKVRKSECWCDNQNEHKVPVYSMRSKQRGLFFCVNNIEFPNGTHGLRSGADVDECKLKELFKQIGFGTQVHRNQTKRDMQLTINKLVENDNLMHFDCLVVAVMSHGTEGSTKENTKIVTSDAQYLSVSFFIIPQWFDVQILVIQVSGI